ncbi:porin [Roseobacter ponti]|uniref:Porin n=1 Tax=Roseobacter ponti TaxID=1891787 RepID=A0A858SPV9_9RHOB|nr:porin [Roseobacter ponti]QJF49888.1 porin [Roseobacter ponti]
MNNEIATEDKFMKKLLIATTALVGTAGVVAADTTFSGYGRFGILYEEDRGGGTQEETRLESRYRLNIDSSTETDGGIRFAVRVRIQGDDGSNGEQGTAGLNGARFQVNAGGLRVRVGNISGVHDAAEVVNFFGFEPGLIGQVGHYSTFGGGPIDFYEVRSNGVTGVNVKYEMGDFAVMASYSPDYSENLGTGPSSTDDYEAFEIGASYTVSGWTFGVGYGTAQDDDGAAPYDTDFWTATATGTVGIADIAFFVGDSDGDFTANDDVAYGISGSVPVGAATNIVASVAGGGADALDEAYGIGFTHSLGGGVSLSGMVGSNTSSNTVADLGVRFNF